MIGISEEQLNEELGNVLFHYTRLNNVISILESNRIKLSSSLGTDADNFNGKPFFLSTSRSGSVDSGYAVSGGMIIRLVFDKNKIEQRLTTKPVDYWQRKDPNSPTLKGLQPDDRKNRMNKDFEFEERIYSDRPYLDNASNYIKEIEVLLAVDDSDPDFTNSGLLRLKTDAQKRNIPLSVYKNKADLFKKQNSITNTISSDQEYKPYEKSKSYAEIEPMIALVMYDEQYYDYDRFEPAFDQFILKNNITDKVNKFKVHDMIRSLSFSDNPLIGLISDLHNTFKSAEDNILRKNIWILVNELKRNKVNTVRELYTTKVKGLRPKTGKLDYSNTVKLEYKSDYQDEPNTLIPPNTPLTKLYGIYFNSYKYGGNLPDEDAVQFFTMRENNGTLGQLINYIYNKFTPKKADQIFKDSVKDDGRIIVQGLIKT